MIRYPLYVTIDTNIFDSTGYDLGDNGTLGHLYSYVQSGKIKIVLSNIVIREAQQHIKESMTRIILFLMEIIEDCLEVLEPFIDEVFPEEEEEFDLSAMDYMDSVALGLVI